MKIKILHTADWHLRPRQYNTGQRGDDFTAAANRVVDLALEHKVHAIANCGDILDSRKPASRSIKDLQDIDRRLRDHGMPMYTITGNHDLATPSWLSRVSNNRPALEEVPSSWKGRVVDPSEVKEGIVDCDGIRTLIHGTNLTLFGVPSVGAHAFRELRGNWPGADIMLSHELVKEFAAFDPGDDCLAVADYPDTYQAVMLGDVHASKVLPLDGGARMIGYPGSTELCSANEPVDKSVLIWEFEDAGPGKCKLLSVTPVPFPTRKALFYRIIAEEDLDRARAEVTEHLDENPIVLIRYNPDLTTTPSLFHTTIAGTDTIMRCSALPMAQGKLLYEAGDLHPSLESLKQPRDFVHKFFVAGTSTYNLTHALADPEADHRMLVDNYIEDRLKDAATF